MGVLIIAMSVQNFRKPDWNKKNNLDYSSFSIQS